MGENRGRDGDRSRGRIKAMNKKLISITTRMLCDERISRDEIEYIFDLCEGGITQLDSLRILSRYVPDLVLKYEKELNKEDI